MLDKLVYPEDIDKYVGTDVTVATLGNDELIHYFTGRLIKREFVLEKMCAYIVKSTGPADFYEHTIGKFDFIYNGGMTEPIGVVYPAEEHDWHYA